MTQATSLTSRWYSTPRTITPHGFEDDGKPYWKVEGVTVRLGEHDTLQLTSQRYGETSNLRVEVGDGEIRFPLEDLVPLVLERLDIGEVSEMICGNEDARRRLLDALANRYNQHGIEDADRRYWIAKAQAEVHDKALDALTYSMASIEHAVASVGYRAMDSIAYENVIRSAAHDVARECGKTWDEANELADAAAQKHAYKPSPDLIEFKRFVSAIGIGVRDSWNEARDFWRGQVSALFANVEVPAEPTEASEAA